jgi:hypothetical protein
MVQSGPFDCAQGRLFGRNQTQLAQRRGGAEIEEQQRPFTPSVSA